MKLDELAVKSFVTGMPGKKGNTAKGGFPIKVDSLWHTCRSHIPLDCHGKSVFDIVCDDRTTTIITIDTGTLPDPTTIQTINDTGGLRSVAMPC